MEADKRAGDSELMLELGKTVNDTHQAKQLLAVSLLYVLHYDQHCYHDPVCYETDGISIS